MRSFHVQTSAGRLAVRLSPGYRDAILMAHGNSMSKTAFERQLEGPVGRVYRLIAVDLPGHGESDRPTAPERSYTLVGFADVLLEILTALDASDALVCGWSLGGHVALEMMRRSRALRGALIVSAPPVKPGPAAIGAFVPSEALALLGRDSLSANEAALLLDAIWPSGRPAWAADALAQADGRARRLFLEHFLSGAGADPEELFADETRPLGFAVGEREPFIRRDAFDTLRGPAIWRGGVQVIPGAGHAPFFDAPEAFNTLLLAFLRDAARQRPQARASTGPERLRA